MNVPVTHKHQIKSAQNFGIYYIPQHTFLSAINSVATGTILPSKCEEDQEVEEVYWPFGQVYIISNLDSFIATNVW